MADMDDMAAQPSVTQPQIVAMTVLTLLALGAGVVIATVYGRWAM